MSKSNSESQKSPFRLRWVEQGGYRITRIDDPKFDEKVGNWGEKDKALAAARRYHREWHLSRIACPLERFIARDCKVARGHRVTLAEFWTRFEKSLPPSERLNWGKHTIRKRLPSRFPCGPATGNVVSIGNLSFDRYAFHKAQRYRLVDGRLKLSDNSQAAGCA